MRFPVIELVDRYAIATLKNLKTGKNQDEVDFYKEQLANYDLNLVVDEMDKLYKIHETIWGLESELKSGRERELPLEEIGRRAILIRDWNNKRVAVKNAIAEKLGRSEILEVKYDHLSEIKR